VDSCVWFSSATTPAPVFAGCGPFVTSVFFRRCSRGRLRGLVPPHPFGARDRKVPSAPDRWFLTWAGRLPSVTVCSYLSCCCADCHYLSSLSVNLDCLLKSRPSRLQIVTVPNRLAPNATSHPSRGRPFQTKHPNGGLDRKPAKAGARAPAAENRRNRPSQIQIPPRRQPRTDERSPKRLSLKQTGPFHTKERRVDVVPSQNPCRSGGF